MELSIIIPIYNEREKIRADIEAAAGFLTTQDIAGEVLIVDNASNDDSAEVAHGTEVPESVSKKVIINSENLGKGYAVASGVKQSSGRFVMFADSGSCIPYTNILPALQMLREGACDVAHGSRRLPTSIIKRHPPVLRRILSKVYRYYTFSMLGIPGHYTDTQCGFKIYHGEKARELFAESIINGFLFDIDIMARALKRGYRVVEFPGEWTSDPDSKVIPHRLAFGVLSDVVAIRKDISQKYFS